MVTQRLAKQVQFHGRVSLLVKVLVSVVAIVVDRGGIISIGIVVDRGVIISVGISGRVVSISVIEDLGVGFSLSLSLGHRVVGRGIYHGVVSEGGSVGGSAYIGHLADHGGSVILVGISGRHVLAGVSSGYILVGIGSGVVPISVIEDLGVSLSLGLSLGHRVMVVHHGVGVGGSVSSMSDL